jgi:MFS family permease
VRYGVLGFACTLSMITYLDRVCFGSAASDIQREFGLSETQKGMLFTAFAFAYAIFEVPTGWLGDTYGPRRTLIRIVLWWSAFTALTGLVHPISLLPWFGFTAMLAVRFLFGVGEAGAYPNLTRALHNWFPSSSWAFGQGMVWMCGRLMGGLTPLVWLLVVVLPNHSWRIAFYLFGAVGAVWCVSFYLWFRDRPEQHPSTNEAEQALILAGRPREEASHAGVPWLKLLKSGNLWVLCLMYFCAAYGWYFNITYLPRFLEQQYHVDPESTWGAIYKGGPLLFGATTCLIGGFLSDRFIRATGNRRWGRRLFGVVGHSLCGLCYLACLGTGSAFTFFLAISFAAFWNDLTMGAAWATCQDIGRRYAAIVAGCMNTIGNLGGAAAGFLTGYILDLTLAAHARHLGVTVRALQKDPNLAADRAAGLLPGYQINFFIFAAVYGVAVVLWFFVDATRPVAPEAVGAPAEGPAGIPPGERV